MFWPHLVPVGAGYSDARPAGRVFAAFTRPDSVKAAHAFFGMNAFMRRVAAVMSSPG
jgi:hypothetical protein